MDRRAKLGRLDRMRGLSIPFALALSIISVATHAETIEDKAQDCTSCHGEDGEGSPPAFLNDGGVVYPLPSGDSPFPAPGLNDALSDAGVPALAAAYGRGARPG